MSNTEPTREEMEKIILRERIENELDQELLEQDREHWDGATKTQPWIVSDYLKERLVDARLALKKMEEEREKELRGAHEWGWYKTGSVTSVGIVDKETGFAAFLKSQEEK